MSASGTRVYVGRLPNDARDKDIEKFFKGYGKLREILMKNGYTFVEFDDPKDADDAVYELNGKEMLGERLIIEHARASRQGGGGSRGGGDRFGGGGDRYGGGGDRYGGGGDRYGGGGGGRFGGGGGYGGGGGGGGRFGGGRDRYGDSGFNNRQPSGGGRYGPPQRTDYRLRVENLSSRASWQDLKDHMRTAGVEVTFADAHKQRTGEGVVEFSSESDMMRAIDKMDNTDINGKKIKLVEEGRGGRGGGSGGGSRRRTRSRSRSRSRSRNRSRSDSRSSRSSRSSTPPKKRSRTKSAEAEGGD
ncbi:serine/arginine-rich splicing factor 5-like isoform X2 [Mya arenaria]|uniref:serine/arginine-rich splicing factor 5-like isoform X2 n=1 Tax=Mya arenaria TaxID=6604 RepID=UPI0022E54BB8|nr:serine/arginine-rich splicing factor 5-like isoform X2 [Mya arenaria]